MPTIETMAIHNNNGLILFYDIYINKIYHGMRNNLDECGTYINDWWDRHKCEYEEIVC